MTKRKSRIHPVILSGGAGTRLWPLSRERRPKHLIQLTGETSLLQQAASRALDADRFAPITVIASAEHQAIIAEQLRSLDACLPTIVLEPVARNTAAAAAVAALVIGERDPAGILLLMPADHRILDVTTFLSAVDDATEAARKGLIVLFGVRPKAPATGYGYIRAGKFLFADTGVRTVGEFVEKPDERTAKAYIDSGEYLWNTGIFLLSAETLIAEMSIHAPEILGRARDALGNASRDPESVWLNRYAFERCPATSIDYAVMEKTSYAAVLPVDFDWTDVGSWSSLWEIAERDDDGNAVIGDVVSLATRDSYLRSEGPLVAAIGLEGAIVVAMKDVVLVADRKYDQRIKEIVEKLKTLGAIKTL